ncbi:hypothetical protein XENORESO_020861 [Xenotaenia resolanae]|uniref:Uncharacterized protein n=1 Tax=Xenotaenia resolanae TaxID=208358 RepID=A0ABV0VTL9_9TELE
MCKSLFPHDLSPISTENFHPNIDLSPACSTALSGLLSAHMPAKILLDSSSTLLLRIKSPSHIAAVSQDEQMTMAGDTGALLLLAGYQVAVFGPLRAPWRVTCPGERNATDVSGDGSSDSSSSPT